MAASERIELLEKIAGALGCTTSKVHGRTVLWVKVNGAIYEIDVTKVRDAPVRRTQT